MVGQRKTQRGTTPIRRAPTGKEPYEEAIQILRDSATFAPRPWHTFELPHHVEPLLRVSAMDEWLGWPLGKAQAREVTDAYTTSPGVAVVPAAHLSVQSADWHHALDMAHQYVQMMYSQRASLSLQLSHLLLDATGVAPTLSLPTAGSVGTVAFLLPSMCTGGEMLLTNDDVTHVWQHDTYLTRLHCLIHAASTVVTVHPITSGRRALLVYDVVDMSPSTSVADAVATLAAAARVTPKPFHFMSLRLSVPNPTLAYDQLTDGDKNVVQALLQSCAYDVVLAEHEKYVDLFSVGDTGYAATIKRFEEVPGAALPAVVSDRTHYLSAEALLLEAANPRKDNYSGPRYSIFFWPKCARLLIVDLETGVHALQDAVRNRSVGDTLLGQPSIDALRDALLLRFNDPSEPEVDNSYGQSLCVFCDVLIARKETATAQHLLRDVVRYTKDADSFGGVASAISNLIACFGWETLSVSLHAMLRRWSTSARGLHLCYCLVANLAGATESPLCAPISQPFAAECIVSLWSQLAAEVEYVIQPGGTVIVEDGCMSDKCAADAPRAIFQSTLCLQLYIARQERVRERWFYNRLPDRAVVHIASFLGPAVSLAEMQDMDIFEPVLDMTPGLAAAMRLGMDPRANMGFVTSILDAYLHGTDPYLEDNVDFNQQLVASLFMVAAVGHQFTAVLDRLTFDRHLALAPSILEFVQRWPEMASPGIRQECSELLLDAAGDSIVANQGRLGRCPPWPVRNAVSALTYFAQFDRAHLMTFMATWLTALGRDHIRTTLGDVVLELHAQVPSEARLLSRLARVYLADVANEPTVQRLTDYALLNIAVPACCDHCRDFDRYLQDPVRVTYAVGAWNACDRILELVRRHPLQLQLQHTTSPRHDENFELEHDIAFDEVVDEAFVCKVRQPGQVTASALRDHLARQRDATELAKKTQRITDIRDAAMAAMMGPEGSTTYDW